MSGQNSEKEKRVRRTCASDDPSSAPASSTPQTAYRARQRVSEPPSLPNPLPIGMSDADSAHKPSLQTSSRHCHARPVLAWFMLDLAAPMVEELVAQDVAHRSLLHV